MNTPEDDRAKSARYLETRGLEPVCRETGAEAISGTCPVHKGDRCLIAASDRPAGLSEGERGFAVGDVWNDGFYTRAILAVYDNDVMVACEWPGGRQGFVLPKRLFLEGCCGRLRP